MFQLDNFRYIFVNESVDTLNSNGVIKAMFKDGLRHNLINCVGAPNDKIVYYENSHIGLVISNITALFDTLVVDTESRVVQHPVQMVFIDMYIRL